MGSGSGDCELVIGSALDHLQVQAKIRTSIKAELLK